MSESELLKKKQDKLDRKEFNGTLVAVGEEDEPLVGRLMATGSNPDAVEDPAAEAAAAPAAKGEAPASTGNESELAMQIVRHAPTHPRST